MPQFLWPSFSGGILGPQSIGRVDVQGYARAAKDIVNFIVDLRGGLIKRPGTWNVPIRSQRSLGKMNNYYDTGARAFRVKLIPFVFTSYETRLILFVNDKTNLISDGDNAYEGQYYVFKFNYAERDRSGGYMSAIPYSIALGTHRYTNPQLIKYAQINDVLYLASPERPFSKMMRTSSDSQAEEYNIEPVNMGLSLMWHPSGKPHSSYTIDIGGPHKIPSGWPIVRDADGNIPKGPNKRIKRANNNIKPGYSYSTWDSDTFSNMVPSSVVDGGGSSDKGNYSLYYVVQPDFVSYETRIVGGTLSITDGDKTWEGPIVDSLNWIYTVDTPSDSAEFVFTILVIRKDLASGDTPEDEKANWRIEGAIFEGVNSDMNNPKAVAVHEQRLWVAGTKGEPSSIWASAVRDYENFGYEIAKEQEVKDSDALKFTLAANNQDPIYWLQPSNAKLFAGTSETVYILQGSDQTGITPTSIKVTSDSRIGTRNMQPAVVGDAIIAPYRTGQQLQILGYRFETDSFQSINMNLLCGEITRPGIRAMAWQQEPYQCLWCVMRDGTLATYTMDTSTAEGGTRAWARHTTTAGNFIDVCSLPYVGPYSYDCMFFLVDRGIPGTEGNGDICLEYMPLDRGFWGFGVVDACRSDVTADENRVEVRNGVPTKYPTRDSQFTYDPPGNHVPPPYLRDWLMKETKVGADESFIESGVPIFAKLETLPSEVYDPSHAFLGLKKKRAGTVIVRVLNTWDLKLNGDNIFSRLVFQYGYERAKVLDGLLRWNNFGWSHEGTLQLIHDEAFPCHILTVGYRLDVGGDD